MCAIASSKDSEAEHSDSHELRAELNIETATSKEDYLKLDKDREVIERELCEKAVWYNPENRRVCKVYFRKTVDNIFDESKWLEFDAWLLDKLELLHRVFSQRVKAL